MLQKLFSLVDQTSVPDNPDALSNHEVLEVGQLIAMYLKVVTFVVIMSLKIAWRMHSFPSHTHFG